jgi:AAA domain
MTITDEAPGMEWQFLSADLKALWVAECGIHHRGLTAEDVWDRASAKQRDDWCSDAVRKPVGGYFYGGGEPPDATGEREQTMFKRWTMAQLLAEPSEFEWLAAGLLADPTYGQIAGEMKTLKSYVTGFIEVGIATGLPIFGHFTPPAPRPVVAYVGEGGRKLWTRRIRRICSAMGTTPEEIDLHPTFDVAPISSLTFQDSLRRDLDDLQPGLVTLDPLYTYHGTETRAADLHQEGALLNLLSAPCMNAGASLAVVNHYNQTGSGMSLKRITMAGSGEWADSWVLIAHREDPDVDAGLFRLTLEIGSRQWGGTSWDLDLSIGRFDMDTGSHDGEIAWDLNRASTVSADGKGTARTDKAESRILDTLADHPWELTKR